MINVTKSDLADYSIVFGLVLGEVSLKPRSAIRHHTKNGAGLVTCYDDTCNTPGHKASIVAK